MQKENKVKRSFLKKAAPNAMNKNVASSMIVLISFLYFPISVSNVGDSKFLAKQMHPWFRPSPLKDCQKFRESTNKQKRGWLPKFILRKTFPFAVDFQKLTKTIAKRILAIGAFNKFFMKQNRRTLLSQGDVFKCSIVFESYEF